MRWKAFQGHPGVQGEVRRQWSKRGVDLKINLYVNVLCSEQEWKSKQRSIEAFFPLEQDADILEEKLIGGEPTLLGNQTSMLINSQYLGFGGSLAS